MVSYGINTIKINLRMLVKYNIDKSNLLSSWQLKIDHLALSNNQSITHIVCKNYNYANQIKSILFLNAPIETQIVEK